MVMSGSDFPASWALCPELLFAGLPAWDSGVQVPAYWAPSTACHPSKLSSNNLLLKIKQPPGVYPSLAPGRPPPLDKPGPLRDHLANRTLIQHHPSPIDPKGSKGFSPTVNEPPGLFGGLFQPLMGRVIRTIVLVHKGIPGKEHIFKCEIA